MSVDITTRSGGFRLGQKVWYDDVKCSITAFPTKTKVELTPLNSGHSIWPSQIITIYKLKNEH